MVAGATAFGGMLISSFVAPSFHSARSPQGSLFWLELCKGKLEFCSVSAIKPTTKSRAVPTASQTNYVYDGLTSIQSSLERIETIERKVKAVESSDQSDERKVSDLRVLMIKRHGELRHIARVQQILTLEVKHEMDANSVLGLWATFNLQPTVIAFRMPIAVPFVVLLIFSLYLINKNRRQSLRSDTCRRCSYTLIGNLSGICPECGALITEQQRALLVLQAGTPEGSLNAVGDQDR